MPPPPPQTMALGQLRFSELGAEEPPMGEESLEGLKALTAKLKLQTRRPSYLEWEARVRGQPWGSRTPGGAEGTPGNPKGERDGVGVCGFPTVGEALEWLRTELVSRGWGVRGARGGAQPWQGGLQLQPPSFALFFTSTAAGRGFLPGAWGSAQCHGWSPCAWHPPPAALLGHGCVDFAGAAAVWAQTFLSPPPELCRCAHPPASLGFWLRADPRTAHFQCPGGLCPGQAPAPC